MRRAARASVTCNGSLSITATRTIQGVPGMGTLVSSGLADVSYIYQVLLGTGNDNILMPERKRWPRARRGFARLPADGLHRVAVPSHRSATGSWQSDDTVFRSRL
jgi:hypothetical protein